MGFFSNVCLTHRLFVPLFVRSFFFFFLVDSFDETTLTRNRNERFASGMIAAVMSGMLCFTFLENMFYPSTEIAVAALYLVTLYGFFVGLSLGVLLPRLLPGAFFGVLLALTLCAVFPYALPLSFYGCFFPIAGVVLGAAGAFASYRYVLNGSVPSRRDDGIFAGRLLPYP